MSRAELHRFDGRLYACGEWGRSRGRRVFDDVRPEVLGRELARFLQPRWWQRTSAATLAGDVRAALSLGDDVEDLDPEQLVLQAAAGWSIDPTLLDTTVTTSETGLLGGSSGGA